MFLYQLLSLRTTQLLFKLLLMAAMIGVSVVNGWKNRINALAGRHLEVLAVEVIFIKIRLLMFNYITSTFHITLRHTALGIT